MGQLQKQFLLVDKGPMTKTLVCVFPWERYLLEEIHGAGAIPVTIDELCDLQGGKVRKIKLNPQGRRDVDGKVLQPEEGLTLRAQYERMVEVDPDDSPANDVQGEWNRLIAVYGKHPTTDTTVAEKVFANVRVFRTCVRDFVNGIVPEMLRDIDDDDDRPVETMTARELKQALTERGIEFKGNASREDLLALLQEQKKAA